MPPPLPPARANGQPPQALPVPPGEARDQAREIEIALDLIAFDEANGLKHTEESTRRLADSIREQGLLNPPLVYEDAGRYRLLAGEGRCLALRLLGWTVTRVRLYPGKPDPQQARDLALIDNLVREDLDPLAFGLYCRDDMARTARSARELAKVLQNKYSPTTITRAVALVNKLPEDLIAMIRARQLPPAVARTLTGLGDDDAKRRFAKLYADGTIKTGEELAEAVRAGKKNGHAAPAPGGSFTWEDIQAGVTIAVTLPGQDPAPAEAVLKSLAKDLHDHGKSLSHFKEFLARKAKLQAAEAALSGHVSSPPPERSTTNG
jgi:ParB/RepB/Spo0J family partition protein